MFLTEGTRYALIGMLFFCSFSIAAVHDNSNTPVHSPADSLILQPPSSSLWRALAGTKLFATLLRVTPSFHRRLPSLEDGSAAAPHRRLAGVLPPMSCMSDHNSKEITAQCQFDLHFGHDQECVNWEYQWFDYRVWRSEPGADSFSAGLVAAGGNPNNFYTWAAKGPTGQYVLNTWYWIIMVILATILLILIIVAAPAICSRYWRRVISNCFCNLCCGFRRRAIKLEEIRHERIRTASILFAVIGPLLLIGIGGSIIYAVRFLYDIRGSACVLRKTTYGLLFGDAPRNGKSLGFFNVVPKLEEEYINLKNASRTHDITMAQFEGLPQETGRQFTQLQRTLEQTKNALRSSVVEFNAGTPQSVNVTRIGQCVLCDDQEWDKQQKALMQSLTDANFPAIFGSGGFGAGFADLGRFIKMLNTEIRTQRVAQDILNASWNYLRHETSIYSLYVVSLLICITVPFVLVGVYGTAVWAGANVKKRAHSNENVADRWYRNLFGSACIIVGIAVAGLAVFSVLSLAVSQFAAEGCEFVQREIIEKNDSYRFSRFRPRNAAIIPVFRKFGDACVIDGADGKFVSQFKDDFPGIDDFTDRKIEDKMLKMNKDIKVKADEVRTQATALLSGGNRIVRTLVSIIMIDFTEPHQWALLSAAIPSVALGAISSHDVAIGVGGLLEPEKIRAGTRRRIDRLTVIDYSGDVNTAFVTLKLKQDYRKPVGLVPGTVQQTHDYGEFLVNTFPKCKIKRVCITANCCGGATDCHEIDGRHSFYVTSGTVVHIGKSRVETAKIPHMRELSACVIDGDSTRLHFAIRAISTHLALSVTRRLVDGLPAFAKATITSGPLTSVTNVKKVSYQTFMGHVEYTWNQIQQINALQSPLLGAASVAGGAKSYKIDPDCRYTGSQIKAVNQFICSNLAPDLGFLGLFWLLLCMICLPLMFLLWRIYHFFADRLDSADILHSAFNGEYQKLEKLVKHINPVGILDQGGNDALKLAVYNNHANCCQLLLDKRCDPNLVNDSGYNAVDVAVMADSNFCIKQLDDAGAYTRGMNPHGDFPLHVAARRGEKPIIEVLLKSEDPERQQPLNNYYETPAEAADRTHQRNARDMIDGFYRGGESSLSLMHTVEELDEELDDNRSRSCRERSLEITLPAAAATVYSEGFGLPERLPTDPNVDVEGGTS